MQSEKNRSDQSGNLQQPMPERRTNWKAYRMRIYSSKKIVSGCAFCRNPAGIFSNEQKKAYGQPGQ